MPSAPAGSKDPVDHHGSRSLEGESPVVHVIVNQAKVGLFHDVLPDVDAQYNAGSLELLDSLFYQSNFVRGPRQLWLLLLRSGLEHVLQSSVRPSS